MKVNSYESKNHTGIFCTSCGAEQDICGQTAHQSNCEFMAQLKKEWDEENLSQFSPSEDTGTRRSDKMVTCEYVVDELKTRISSAEVLVIQAKDCLDSGDYLQCAVRLQELDKIGKFTGFEMNIFESESE